MGHSTVVKSLRGKLEPALFFLNSKIPRERGDTNARVHTSWNRQEKQVVHQWHFLMSHQLAAPWARLALPSLCGQRCSWGQASLWAAETDGTGPALGLPSRWMERVIVVHHGGPSFPHCLWNWSWHPPRYQCLDGFIPKGAGGEG